MIYLECFSSDFSKLTSSFNMKDLPILLHIFSSALQAAFQACFYVTGPNPRLLCFIALLICLHTGVICETTTRAVYS